MAIALVALPLTAATQTPIRSGRVAGVIQVGERVGGSLSSDDPQFPGDSTYFQRWILPVNAKQAFTVELVSRDFDASVILTRGGGDTVAADNDLSDDNTGGAYYARLVYLAQDNHPLRIVFNTGLSRPPSGERFILSVSEAHVIAIGQTQQGTLSRNDRRLLWRDLTYHQSWAIEGRAGQTVTIDLESVDFDARLFLQGPGISDRRSGFSEDDNSGGNCNARLTATFPRNGVYEIEVNATGENATGRFTLSVTSGSKPKSVARCSRSSQ